MGAMTYSDTFNLSSGFVAFASVQWIVILKCGVVSSEHPSILYAL